MYPCTYYGKPNYDYCVMSESDVECKQKAFTGSGTLNQLLCSFSFYLKSLPSPSYILHFLVVYLLLPQSIKFLEGKRGGFKTRHYFQFVLLLETFPSIWIGLGLIHFYFCLWLNGVQ